MSTTDRTIIVGAGLAGLACARQLEAAGRDVVLLERSDGPGGRVRTDVVDGFLLDRGFQVLLDAYPEAQQSFDYAALGLQAFAPGALIRRGGRFRRVADPFRAPLDALASLADGVGTFGDKLRVLALRRRACAGTLDELFARPDTTTREALTSLGFSAGMIRDFFEPFLGGIFLGRDLRTSSRMLEFVFRMMARGGTCLPAQGMGALPMQLASGLRHGTLRLHAEVTAVEPGAVQLASGERMEAAAVVVATEGDVAARLTGRLPTPGARGCTTLYFDASASPIPARWLVLAADDDGPINSVCVPSDVARAYAPDGRHLISATVLGVPTLDDDALETAVRSQLGRWYGAATVAGWRFLRCYRIPWGQPEQAPPALQPVERAVKLAERLYVAGDHRETASIHGALHSGRRAADAVLADLA